MDFTLSISTRPGVYLFRNKHNQVIYVGKAINLKNRVRSYFFKNTPFNKQKLLVSEIVRIQTIEVESEIEALLLEARLIKKYTPHFNIRLKDDRDYLYVKISSDPFPRVTTARRKDLANTKTFFGPFPNSTLVKKTLKQLRHVFKFCSNPPNPSRRDPRPCFWFHLNQCSGACVGRAAKKAYNRQIKQLATFLNGNKDKLIAELTKDMEKASKSNQFEKAAYYRNQVQGINYITQNTSIKGYLENSEYRQEKRKKEVLALQKVLGLPNYLRRIECYDVSHQSGTNTAASMVVLLDGEPAISFYRHFKIKSHERNDDFASMREVIERRLKRLLKDDPDNSFGERPDLIIVDGGQGQLGAAVSVESELKTKIPFISLAKKEEIIYTPSNQEGIRLPKSDPASLVVQRVRDEAHRFALRLHRNLKGKSLIDTLKGNR